MKNSKQILSFLFLSLLLIPTNLSYADDETTLSNVGSVEQLSTMNGASGVIVDGDYAYVSGYATDYVTVVDISNSTNPTIAETFTHVDMNGPSDIYVLGNYVYVIGHISDTLVILDKTDPLALSYVSTYTNAGDMNQPKEVVVVGDFAYVASAFNSCLVIVDVSVKATPTLEGSVCNATTLGGAEAVDVVGNYAYVASAGYDGLAVIDITDPTSPSILGSVTSLQMNLATGVVVNGDYAYVSAETYRGIAVIDISTPTAPTQVGQYTHFTLMEGAHGIDYLNGFVYVPSRFDNTIVEIDVSDPTAPTLNQSLRDNDFFNRVESVWIDGNYAYMPAYSDRRLNIIQIANVTAPEESVSTAPIFSDINSNGALMSWNATTNSTDLYGYGIQHSLDDVTFTNVIENTANTLTTNLLSGFDSSTLQYLQWRNVFYNGTYGDWSDSGSFTTTQEAGGGGGPISSKTEIPPEDLTPEFIPPEPKKGLTALDIFSANVERIAPGETRKAVLEITWEGDTNLRVEEIVVDESTGLKFAFTQPIEFPPSSSGKTTSEIPYVIEAPEILCTEKQTANCVYNDATYELPTQVFAFSNGESIKFDSFLTINVTDDFNLGMQEIFLGILGLVAVALVLGRTKSKNQRKQLISRKNRSKRR